VILRSAGGDIWQGVFEILNAKRLASPLRVFTCWGFWCHVGALGAVARPDAEGEIANVGHVVEYHEDRAEWEFEGRWLEIGNGWKMRKPVRSFAEMMIQRMKRKL
jgi:hypothetical protein